MVDQTPKLKIPISKKEKRKRVIADRIAMLIIAILLVIMVIKLGI